MLAQFYKYGNYGNNSINFDENSAKSIEFSTDSRWLPTFSSAHLM
jgi:hypothetical protein